MYADTQTCILGVKAEVWRKGHVTSLTELENTGITVLPEGTELADCYEDITDDKELLKQLADDDMFFWDKLRMSAGYTSLGVTESPDLSTVKIVQLTQDIVVIDRLDFWGNSADPVYSCGLDWEIDSCGIDFTLGDGSIVYRGQSSWLNQLAEIAKARTQQDGEGYGCSFLTLWEYSAGKTPDTWLGPGEYWSEWEMLGELTDSDLQELCQRKKPEQ